MKMKEDVDAKIPRLPLRPWVPSWRSRKCAHSPGSDIGCHRTPESPLHAVSPGCVWPARPPGCPPLQSHIHPTPQILRDPLGNDRPPCTPLPRRGERQPRDDLHFYENPASGATPRGAGAAPPGWLLGSAPRRSPALGARAPSPCARPPPPAPILCPALISA